MTYQVEVLNPKAKKLLKDLADLKLISIKVSSENGFIKVVARIRKKALLDLLPLAEITKEVEKVRSKRYDNKKG